MFSKYRDYLVCYYKAARLSVMLMIAIVMLASPARATDQLDYNDPAFGAAVRGWLLDNPDILLEMAAKLDEHREAARAAGDQTLIDANHDALFNDMRDGRIGDGAPAFVEFVDYNCGFCRRNHGDVKAWHKTHPGNAIIIKEFPILGPGSDAAARAVLAVKALHGMQAYQAVHNAFLEMNGPLDEVSIEALFAEFALDENWDVASIKAEMQSAAITAQINDTRALTTALGISGTPGFVFKASIERGLLSLGQLNAATTPKAQPSNEGKTP